MDKFEQLPEEEASQIESLMRFLDVWHEVDPAFPVSYIRAYLMVILKPGLGPQEYAKELGFSQPVTSRILLEIGPKARAGGEGLGLIDTKPRLDDYRSKEAFLTNKGKNYLKRIQHIFGKTIRGSKT